MSMLLLDCYGASLDWHKWQIPQRGDSAFISSLRPIISAMLAHFRPKLGSRASFRFWMDEWSRNGRLCLSFPRLFALALDPECSVCQAWHGAWAPPMPAALSDQRTFELLRLQELLVNQRPAEGLDGWTWCEPRFSVRGAYRRLRAHAASEDPLFLRIWQRIWRSRIPLKIWFLLWLLLWRRLMTRSLRQCMVPNCSAECAMCGAIPEDCDHIFIRCPVAQAVWTLTRFVRPRSSSLEVFWRSMADGPYRRRTEWQLLYATLWVLWTHRNEVVFRGLTPSADTVVHEAGGLVTSWNRAGLSLSVFVTL